MLKLIKKILEKSGERIEPMPDYQKKSYMVKRAEELVRFFDEYFHPSLRKK